MLDISQLLYSDEQQGRDDETPAGTRRAAACPPTVVLMFTKLQFTVLDMVLRSLVYLHIQYCKSKYYIPLVLHPEVLQMYSPFTSMCRWSKSAITVQRQKKGIQLNLTVVVLQNTFFSRYIWHDSNNVFDFIKI